MKVNNFVFFILFIFLQNAQLHAASIRLIRELSTPEVSAVLLVGEITAGDANEFLTVVAETQKAVIFLNSDGGNAQEGLALAKLIKKLGYATAVISDLRCMSACALIWVGGSTRYLSKNALVGFHSVYTADGVSGGGNAIYGAFYGQLGLSDRAIVYLTSAPPDGYNQVTLETAALLDIAVLPWDEPDKQISASEQEGSTQNSSPKSAFASEQGVDIIGFDLPNGSFKTESESSCFAACMASSICNAYTFDTKNHICYQKNGGRLLLRNPNAISGARAAVNQKLRRSDLVIYGKKNSPGHDIRSAAKNSLEGCVFECESDRNCKAFTWNKKTKNCAIKNGHESFEADRSLVSGTK